MTDGLNTIESLPDISFIDGLTLEDIQSRLLTDFEDKYREVTGKKIELSKSDPNRIILLGCAQVIYQGLQNIDKGGKMNFLKYAYGEYLDNMAVFKKVTRNPAKFSTVPLKFKLAQKRESATSIPAGTRVTAAHGVYFATTTYAEIPAGELEITVLAECTEPGSIGDDYAAGELSTLVDPIGFISKVENVQKSTGGAETESDKNMAERVYLAPSSYSTAGPDDAYAYWIKSSNADIGDVKISSPVPGLVDIRFIMMDGSIPEDTLITAAYEYVNQRDKRPLTDNVQILKPTIEEYEIDLIYYINTSDSNSAFAIQSKVKTAVDAYIFWQGSKIGRDINPDELIARIKYAGAKRAIVSEPTFRRIGETAKAECIRLNVVYGGLEYD